jgi:hypothetical protein
VAAAKAKQRNTKGASIHTSASWIRSSVFGGGWRPGQMRNTEESDQLMHGVPCFDPLESKGHRAASSYITGEGREWSNVSSRGGRLGAGMTMLGLAPFICVCVCVCSLFAEDDDDAKSTRLWPSIKGNGSIGQRISVPWALEPIDSGLGRGMLKGFIHSDGWSDRQSITGRRLRRSKRRRVVLDMYEGAPHPYLADGLADSPSYRQSQLPHQTPRGSRA